MHYFTVNLIKMIVIQFNVLKYKECINSIELKPYIKSNVNHNNINNNIIY